MSIFVEKILEVLQSRAEITVDLLNFFTLSKSEARKDMYRFLSNGPRRFKTDWAEAYRKRKQFYNTMNYLRREGLIVKKKDSQSTLWKITKSGAEKLKILRKRNQDPLSLINAQFSKPKRQGLTIITFDIPEKERRKRSWLRACLGSMEFNFLQKSVWIGNGAIDEKFLYALKERDMLNAVHIFSVNSKGTIRDLGE